MTPTTLRARAAGYFLAPKPRPTATGDLVPLVRRDPPPPARLVPPGRATPDEFIAPGHACSIAAPMSEEFVARGRAAPPTRLVTRAAVLGPAPGAVATAAALAGALRGSQGFAAAVVATWTPGAAPGLRGPGAPGAIRVAARLSARGLDATAHGRLAWLPLSDHVVAASVAARRASASLDVPLVLALAGPRCDIVEALLREQDLVVVATAQPDGPMARLAVASCPATALACLPPSGARRLLALAGVAEARALEDDLRNTIAPGHRRRSRWRRVT